MTASSHLPDSTPVLIGAGQYVERVAGATSPLSLAAHAAKAALADTGAEGLAATIDTIAVVRLFQDSSPAWRSAHGGSNNPPQSIAAAIGAAPQHRIYSTVGGDQPVSLLMEFARDIARGDRGMVLLTGAEALRNQKDADRAGQTLDWSEEFSEPMEDRTTPPEKLITRPEMAAGLGVPMASYSVIEQARRSKLGMGLDAYTSHMTQLLEPFNRIAQANPYAQFPDALDGEAMRAGNRMTHMYTSRMMARDGVNQGAAILLTSLGKARALGVPENRLVYLHGAAEGVELRLSERVDPSVSMMAALVVDRALEMSGKTIADIQHIDIYSCFPCAVSAITDHLGLPDDGSVQLTLTGGLPYFGGPGNNYSLHGIAEAVEQSRRTPEDYTLVTSNGGFLSKHAVGVFSAVPSAVDWSCQDTQIDQDRLPRKPLAESPTGGRLVSYVVNYRRGEPVHANALGETHQGERFVAATAKDDVDTARQLTQCDDAAGRAISVRTGDSNHTFYFQLVD